MDARSPSWLVGVDIGGTFTDVAAINVLTGELRTAKVLTDQARPERGAATAVAAVGEGHFKPAGIDEVVHGTTLAINTVLERNGPPTALITTMGFRDVLEIGNGSRYDIYDLQLVLPPPIVPRRLRFEVAERMDAGGNEILPLDRNALAQIARSLAEAGVEAVAISFLHAYANSAHEREAARLLGELLPRVHLSLSSEVAPIIREYERTVATVVNAYVGPVAAGYLGRLADELAVGGYAGPVSIMKSDGGTCAPRSAAERPVQILESGPAAGVLAMAGIARRCGCSHAVAFDMGGTTAKACLIVDGHPGMTNELEVGRQKRFKRGSGMPIRIPSIDLVEVGAGGNSIARYTDIGLLVVGPESAASSPGPACYGLGGDRPTVTDADLVLGYLDPAAFAGGTMTLDREAADRCIAESLGEDSVATTAWAIHDLVNETMAQAIRLHCIEHGVDPAEVTLIATGGAGPVHLASVMAKLGIQSAICPQNAGVASAVGLAVAPRSQVSIVSSRVFLDEVDAAELERRFAVLAAAAGDDLAGDGAVTEERWLDVRLEGQGNETRVGLSGSVTPEAVSDAFKRAYVGLYGRSPRPGRIEIVNWAVRLVRPRKGGAEQGGPAVVASAAAAGTGDRLVRFGAAPVPTPILGRTDLAEEFRAGPMIIQEAATAIVVPPGFAARMDDAGNIHLKVTQS